MQKTKIVKVIFLLTISLILTRCSKDDINNNNHNNNSNGKSEVIDRTLFKQLKYAFDNSNSVWKGYSFSSYPLYFIYRENENATSAQRGFLINSPANVTDASKIPEADAHGINAYRYDKQMANAYNILKQGNNTYDFDYKIDNRDYYLQAYSTPEVDRSGGTSAIELGFHEVFHQFQFGWTQPSGSLQEENNYPINNQLLPLQILTMKIGKKMPAETNLANIDKYLSMYVAIRSKEVELDPTQKKLILNMANPQENYEGTAKYVDYTISKSIFSNGFDTAYEMGSTNEITTKSQVREHFAWNIWYGTGAAVTYMLKKKGVAVEDAVKSGKTLYQIASETLNLTNAQKAAFLQQAKNEFNWSEISTEANRLLGLN